MKERKSSEILKDQMDELQSNVPVTSGMKLKEISILIILMVIGFCVYAVNKRMF